MTPTGKSRAQPNSTQERQPHSPDPPENENPPQKTGVPPPQPPPRPNPSQNAPEHNRNKIGRIRPLPHPGPAMPGMHPALAH